MSRTAERAALFPAAGVAGEWVTQSAPTGDPALDFGWAIHSLHRLGIPNQIYQASSAASWMYRHNVVDVQQDALPHAGASDLDLHQPHGAPIPSDNSNPLAQRDLLVQGRPILTPVGDRCR